MVNLGNTNHRLEKFLLTRLWLLNGDSSCESEDLFSET